MGMGPQHVHSCTRCQGQGCLSILPLLSWLGMGTRSAALPSLYHPARRLLAQPAGTTILKCPLHTSCPCRSAAAYHGTPPMELLERYCRRHGWVTGPLARQVLLEDADGGGGQRALLSVRPFSGGDVVTAVSGEGSRCVRKVSPPESCTTSWLL